MKMEAIVQLTVKVPFNADVEALPEPEMVKRTTVHPVSGREIVREGIADPEAHEAHQDRISEQRRGAALRAEEIADKLTIKGGDIIAVQVAEVREA